MTVRSITVLEARVLRDAILRPGLPAGGSVYPGDDAGDTLHLGAFEGNRLVAVSTICREVPPGTVRAHAWRLRGMASVAEVRGQGVGRRLARSCIEHAREHGAEIVWCSSRQESVGFYEGLGFVVVGEPYGLPQFSDRMYVEMRLVLDEDSPVEVT